MLKNVIVLGCLVLLAGCASIGEQSPLIYQASEGRKATLQVKEWYFEGRLAFANEAESLAASINWRHGLSEENIELIGPLAQGRISIAVRPEGVNINDGDSNRFFSGAVADIFQEQLGMNVPVDSLKYWVLGISDPQQSFIAQEEGFFQQGWLVRFKEMQRVREVLLPKKLWMEKDKTRIKIIVDRWDLS